MRNVWMICGCLALLILACRLVEPASPTPSPPTVAPAMTETASATGAPTVAPLTDPLAALPPGTLPPGTRVVLSTTVDFDDDGAVEGLALYREQAAYSEGYGLVVEADSTVHHLGGETPTELFMEEAEHPAEIAVYDHDGDGKTEILVTGLLGPQAAVVNVFRWDGTGYPLVLSLIGEEGVSVGKEGTITTQNRAQGYVIETTARPAAGGLYRTRSSYTLRVDSAACPTPDCGVVAFYEALGAGDAEAAHALLTDDLGAEVAPGELADRFGATLTAMKVQEMGAESGRVVVSVENDGRSIQGLWYVTAVADGWRLERFEQLITEGPDAEETRIQFQPGASSAAVTGYVEEGESDRYVLRAAQGQVLEVALSGGEGRPLLRVRGADGAVLQPELESAWCVRLPSTQDYEIEVFTRQETDYILVVEVTAPSLPPLALVERYTPAYTDLNPPLLHFLSADGADVTVPAENWNPAYTFQVAGDRVYYGSNYATREGVVSFDVPDVGLSCWSPLVAPEGAQLAWMCENLSAASFEELESGAAYEFKLVITDGEGNDPRVVWQHTETGPLYKTHRLVSWRADWESVYLTRRPVGVAWPAFGYHPSMLEVRLKSGEEIVIGEEEAGDAAVSPDGRWLAQAFHGEPDSVQIRSLVAGAEYAIPGLAGVENIGDFSFSPDGRWLVWQETLSIHADPPFRLRAVQLPDGDPFLIYEADATEQSVAGWLEPDQLVVVRHGEAAAGSSYLISLPDGGPGCRISNYDFVGVLEP
mgnify:FL=1